MIRRLANAALVGEALGFLATLAAGLGCLGYVAGLWMLHFADEGRYTAFAFVGLGISALAVAALARIPAALILLLGTAMVLGTGFSLCAGDLFLP